MDTIDQIVDKLQDLVIACRFEQLETDTLEIKSVPSGIRYLFHERYQEWILLKTNKGYELNGQFLTDRLF